jgi:hypothetical protein
MQKFVDFIEKYVQWVAIGLGALFVLFMVYSYVIQPPAKVTIGNETLTPGEVDEYTATHVASRLQTAMNGKPTVTIDFPHHVEQFKTAMNWVNATDISLAGLIHWQPPIPDTIAQEQNPNQVPGQPQQVALAPRQVKALPVLPKAAPAESRFGRSVVLPPPPIANPNQPAGGPQIQQVVAPQPVDKDWVTEMFHLNIADIDAAFKKANIPPTLSNTLFLQVELIREEQINGDWDPATQTVVPTIGVWRSQQPPPPFPQPAQANRAEEAAYYQWATTNQPDILEPAFFTVNGGDQWTMPGEQAAIQQVQFDPATYNGPLDALTPDEKSQVMAARREAMRKKAEDAAKNRPKPSPRPGSGGRPGPGLNPGDMIDGLAPRDPTAGAGRYRPGAPGLPSPYRRPSPDGMSGDLIQGMPMPGAPGMPANVQANLPQPGVDYPSQEFEPSKWAQAKPIAIWAHDDTVKPGKTYRYKIRYKMKNPIWGANNVAANPALANQFALVSPDSDWTAPVTVPSLVNFFVATSKGPNSNTVRFEVFTFEGGQQHSEVFTVSPGDMIGGPKNGIDYTTKWTVVDYRDDPRTGEAQIILVDENGNLTTRSYRADQQDKLYQQLKQAVAQAKAAEAGLAAGNGGAGPIR